MKPNIFLTRSLPEKVTSELRRRFHLRYNRYNRPLSKAAIIRGVQKAEGLISMLNDSIDQEVMNAAPKLKIIANYAVGYNNINVHAATQRRIVVTNTPDVLTETTADLTWALMLSVARRIPESEQFLRSGRWTGWAPTQFLGNDIHEKTLGIVGIGRIGKAVARRTIGFSMKALYYSRHRLPVKEEKKLRVQFVSFPRLLRESDFISLHLPLSKASYHLIDRQALRQMKPTAFLINTARGPIVDEKALIEALTKNKIAGAGLDVFEWEPHVSGRLRKMKNVVLLPHMGSGTWETRIRMGLMVCENLSAVFKGGKPPNQVNETRG